MAWYCIKWHGIACDGMRWYGVASDGIGWHGISSDGTIEHFSFRSSHAEVKYSLILLISKKSLTIKSLTRCCFFSSRIGSRNWGMSARSDAEYEEILKDLEEKEVRFHFMFCSNHCVLLRSFMVSIYWQNCVEMLALSISVISVLTETRKTHETLGR